MKDLRIGTYENPKYQIDMRDEKYIKIIKDGKEFLKVNKAINHLGDLKRVFQTEEVIY